MKSYDQLLHEALEIITGATSFSCDADGNIFGLEEIPEKSVIDAKIAELQAAEPIRLLRIERDRILSQSDWRDLPSYPGADQEEWRTYRQALRDLPSTQTPELDENGNLINVNWPTPPTETV